MKLMNKLGLFTGSDLKNIIETKHERGMRTKITIEQLERTKADIQQWRLALAEAEDEDYPDRTELIRLYQEILLDDVVSGFVEGTKNRILASEFDIVDQNDEIQPDKISQFD